MSTLDSKLAFIFKCVFSNFSNSFLTWKLSSILDFKSKRIEYLHDSLLNWAALQGRLACSPRHSRTFSPLLLVLVRTCSSSFTSPLSHLFASLLLLLRRKGWLFRGALNYGHSFSFLRQKLNLPPFPPCHYIFFFGRWEMAGWVSFMKVGLNFISNAPFPRLPLVFILSICLSLCCCCGEELALCWLLVRSWQGAFSCGRA